MKRNIAIAAVMALAALPVHAQEGHGDWAKVTSVTPEYQRVNNPREECWTERVSGGTRSASSAHPYAGPIIGGIAGGLLGSQVGGGSGKKVATAAGAIIGTIVGGNLQNNAAYADAGPQTVQRCRVTDQWESRLTGYHVVYQYAGRSYSAMLPYDPGSSLRVRVSVEPDERGRRHD